MSAPAPAPRLVLVTGAPSSGKSTLAEAVAGRLTGCAVVGWDWVMAPLTRYPSVQAAVRGLARHEYRRLGWSLMWSVAEEQLRGGRSVVLDGVARETEIEETRTFAARTPAGHCLVVALECRSEERARQRKAACATSRDGTSSRGTRWNGRDEAGRRRSPLIESSIRATTPMLMRSPARSCCTDDPAELVAEDPEPLLGGARRENRVPALGVGQRSGGILGIEVAGVDDSVVG